MNSKAKHQKSRSGTREGVRDEMGRIKQAIDETVEDLPRRKIRLAA
jgi:hypothetical protein